GGGGDPSGICNGFERRRQGYHRGRRRLGEKARRAKNTESDQGRQSVTADASHPRNCTVHFASAQFAPRPTSTVSGTRSEATPSIVAFDKADAASASSASHSRTSSSCT